MRKYFFSYRKDVFHTLKAYKQLDTGFFRPIGATDSEHAFCWILEQLRIKYPRKPANMKAMFKFVASLADQLRAKGVFNMLLSNGEFVMAYCSTNLHWITRRAPFGEAQLADADVTIDFYKETTPNDVVTMIATQPLTNNEQWQKIASGSYVLFKDGEVQ